MSLLLRINLFVTVLFVTVFLLVSGQALLDAKQRIQHEVAENATLSSTVVDAYLALFQSHPHLFDSKQSDIAKLFHLDQFNNLDYLIIEFIDVDGKMVASNVANAEKQSHFMPLWLQHQLSLLLGHPPPIIQPVFHHLKHLGDIVIRVDMDRALRDVWYQAQLTILPVIIFIGLAIITLMTFVYWLLKPISELIRRSDALQSTAGHKAPLLRIAELPKRLRRIGSELTQSNEQLNQLNHQIIHLQEDERRRLSAELHDELGQHITAIGFEAAAIESETDINHAHQSANAIAALAREMKDIVRSMLQRLRPAEIELMGLEAAIQEMVDEWRQRHAQLQVSLRQHGQPSRLSEAAQLSLYRLVQEGLTNISRHAGKQTVHVDIAIEHSNTHTSVAIKDDGQGCNLNSQQTGFGLKGMRERVERLSGTLKLLSQPGEGMSVSAFIPTDLLENNHE